MRKKAHYERCRDCKKSVRKLLEKFFGKVEINYDVNLPSKIEDYLNRIFGFDYMEIAYKEWDHANNCAIEKQICRVIDREPGKVEFAEMPLD